MKVRSRARLAATLAALALCCAPAAAPAADKAEARIPFALPTLKADQMPPVFFSHERHVNRMEELGKDCTTCHRETADGMSEAFRESETVSADKAAAYMHKECVACHTSVAGAAGPRLAFCRSCHSSDIAQAQPAKKNQAHIQ